VKKGKVIIICGLPGSGKSTLARKLEANSNAMSLVPDEWIIRLFGRDNNPEKRDKVEKMQLDLAIKMAGAGLEVILENGFWSAEERLSLTKKCSNSGISVEAHFLLVSNKLRENRIKNRNLSLGEFDYHMNQGMIDDCNGKFEEPEEGEIALYENAVIIRE
jgi:predicted kinase